INGVLFFKANINGLWKTDGTEAGTTLIRDGILPGGRVYGCGGGFAAIEDALVFAARDQNGCELWRSDGVTAEPLVDINPGPAGAGPRTSSGRSCPPWRRILPSSPPPRQRRPRDVERHR